MCLLLRTLSLLAISLPASYAQEAAKPAEPPLPGHSMHGEAFNEGPRQFAVLMPGVQSVKFPITAKNPVAQKFFNQGVTQLHGFWYFEAERSFRQVAYLDPDCAMAYWGMAMANTNTEKRAVSFMKEATKRRDKVSPREQRWVDAWAAFYSAEKQGRPGASHGTNPAPGGVDLRIS
jgi:hypothetical protein